MPLHKGNAHGKHITEEELEADLERNHNRDKGRRHVNLPSDELEGGKSIRRTSHHEHEFAHGHQEHAFSHQDRNHAETKEKEEI